MLGTTFIIAFIVVLLAGSSAAHSWMTEPQTTAPRECSLGGAVKPGGPIRTCTGPCDITSNTFLKNANPQRPAAIYKRGQTVTIKYNRNNHGPGGFVRMTLVPVDKMMDKEAHARNAFHYSCWGANPVVASPADSVEDRFGFSIAGGDGSLHSLPKSYHETNITIPAAVPNGNYVLGWVWYGGIGGPIERNVPSRPFPNGFFSDYWSCSFVRVSGGARLARSFQPIFDNNMSEYWPRGCFSANDEPGVCKVEPCRNKRGSFQVPKPFKNGAPARLTPTQFRKAPCARRVRGFCGAPPTPVPLAPILQEAYTNLYTCRYPSFVQ